MLVARTYEIGGFFAYQLLTGARDSHVYEKRRLLSLDEELEIRNNF
jgi:hypothetical protein